MITWITWVVLIIIGYLVGSIPFSYLVSRTRGINLKKQGTHQLGAGNVWRLVSRRLGLLVGAFDFFKGIIMVVIAYFLKMDAGEQLFIGLAVIAGHNWPVFLRFHGGRGIATLFGLAVILPVMNYSTISPWPTIIALGFVLIMLAIYHSTPLPVLISVASLSLTSWLFHAGIAVSLAYLAIFLVVVLKRLTAQPAPEKLSVSRGRLFVNRLFFDRDIADRHEWVHRSIHKKEIS
jgi:acyl phosphate:glycerol-3-phosphate acyltransferase